MTLAIISAYLLALLAIGVLSHRLARGTGEDFYVATRSLGPVLLLLSLFGTNMTAFALVGASGEAYHEGIGVFALMASSSALVIPCVFFFVGTRIWALGKRHGYLTQAQLFRDRWQSDAVGMLLFAVLSLLLIPYILIGVQAGGITLAAVTRGAVPDWAGNALLCVVVLLYVGWGGLRGTAWANAFQTLLFMALGLVTLLVVVHRLGGLGAAMARVAAAHPDLLAREGKVQPLELLTYTCVPLSVGMFPHIFMNWLAARSARSFRPALVLYPLCIAAVWIPSVVLGVLGHIDFPDLVGPASNGVMVRLIGKHAGPALAGLLVTGVLSVIMASDSQILALSTMFTEDVVRRTRFGRTLSERGRIRVAQGFVALLLLLVFLLSLVSNRSIFKLGVWAFSGFSALFPVVLAALFWRRSTATGAILSTLTVVVLWTTFFALGFDQRGYTIGGTGVMPVALMLAASAAAMVLGSLLTRPPEEAVLRRFFPG